METIMDMLEVLQAAVKYGVSDIHIVPGRPPSRGHSDKTRISS
jgi:hypothetical protein